MKDVLDTIVAHKRIEIARQKEVLSTHDLEARVTTLTSPTRSMRKALAESNSGIIAEFKRKSPSKGWIHEQASPEDVVPRYERGGASASSILTDEPFFGGTMDFVRRVRPLVNLPILRKDFILDPYQLLQAKEIGADAVLLIAACLSLSECKALASEAHELGLEVLLEVHSEAELDYTELDVDMVGVNNRNLGTFVTSVDNSFRMAERLPADKLLVSESGISKPHIVRELREAGYRGFLMGECFMKEADPGEALAQFVAQL